MSRKILAKFIEGNTPVLVLFYAPWCVQSRNFFPYLKEVSAEFEDRLHVLKVNLDKDAADALKYSVRCTPTLMCFHKGKILWKKAGRITKDELSQQLNDLLLLEEAYH